MLLFIIPALLAAAASYWDSIKDAYDSLFPPAPKSTPDTPPYVPPFLGGQCVGATYSVTIRRQPSGYPLNPPYFEDSTVGGLKGAIAGLNKIGTVWNIQTGQGNIMLYTENQQIIPNTTPVIISVTRTDGVDNCGNLPNPNPSSPTSDNGLSDVPAPLIPSPDSAIPSTQPIAAGIPLAIFLPFLTDIIDLVSDFTANLAISDAIAKLAEISKKLGDGIKDIQDRLKDAEKDNPKKKDYYIYNYGSIAGDGSLKLIPDIPIDGYAPLYLDLQLFNIPLGQSRYLGFNSPNFYRYKELGYIAFASPSFGILSVHEIEFKRTSISVPENATGFFYHLGLDGVINANVSLHYLRSKP